MNTFYTFLDSEIPTLIEKYKKDNSWRTTFTGLTRSY
jgi:hypothetical protein